MAAFELNVTFLSRRLKFNTKDPGHYTVILPSQVFKRHKIENGTKAAMSIDGTDAAACVKLQNAVEYGLEYSFLKPPNALASEELLLSLGVEANAPSALKVVPLALSQIAKELAISYLEHFDMKDGIWKKVALSAEAADPQNLNCINYYGTGNEHAHPGSKWWYALLNGSMNSAIGNSLMGSILATGNVFSLNLKGVLARFKVIGLHTSSGKSKRVGMGAIGANTKITVKLVEGGEPSVTKDVKTNVNKLGGLTQPLEMLKRHVVYPLLYTERYSHLGIFPPTGVLLYGPPGCGKTLIAKAMRENLCDLFGLKKDIPVHIKLVQSSDLISSLVGRTEENIAALFEECSEIAMRKPCICFIDEIDALCRKRDGSTEFNARNVNAFLNHMDGVSELQPVGRKGKGYVIIGTTNYVDSIDQALRRPGRFDLEIEVGVPTAAERLDILKTMLGDIHHNLSEDDIIHVNEFCQAFVGADLKQLVATASWNRLNNMNNETDHDGNNEDDTDHDGNDEDDTAAEEEHAGEAFCITLNDFEEALKVTRPSALRELYVQLPDVHWDDIGGYEDVKLILRECIEYPRTYSAAYEKMRVQPPKGLLLYGPPGCSKTLMAKAVATESHMNFISVKGPELFSKWVGESERAIRQLFRKARTNAPCVIFFDEMDSISVSREISDPGGVGSRVLSQLLNEMDGINSMKHVLVIGATNRPDLMDPALLRPGRLDRLIYIPLPDMEARRRIFWIYMKRLPTDGFDLDKAAEEFAHSTNGYSGAEIAMICRESAMAALREFIRRDTDSKKPESNLLDHQEERALEDDFEKLTLNDIVPISMRHFRGAIDRIKPRTKRETIDFYEEYKAKHTF